MMDLVQERDGDWLRVVRRYSADLAFGDDEENDFTVEISSAFVKDVDGTIPQTGDLLFFPESEWGGVVDEVKYDTTGSYPSYTFSGRTWHGIMSHSIIRPDSGSDYLIVSGSARDVIAAIIERQGLSGVFRAVEGDEAAISSYQFDRYTDMYTGLRKMLASVGMRLNVIKSRGLCQLSATSVANVTDGVDDNYLAFKMVHNARPVNHLVCLGSGELAARAVIDLYADESNAISQTQSLYGIDEVAETYDYSSAEDEESLLAYGIERLQSYLDDASSIDVDLSDDMMAHIGDIVTARSVETGMTVTSTVSVITVAVKNNDTPDISYKVGSVNVF